MLQLVVGENNTSNEGKYTTTIQLALFINRHDQDRYLIKTDKIISYAGLQHGVSSDDLINATN